MLAASQLGIKCLAVPISINVGVRHFLTPQGATLHYTRIGSPFVIAEMQRLRQAGNDPVAGWEANGGFLLFSDLHNGSRRLPALATRDAVLPLITTLLQHRQQKHQGRSLQAGLPQFVAESLLKDQVPMERMQGLMRRLTYAPDWISADLQRGQVLAQGDPLALLPITPNIRADLAAHFDFFCEAMKRGWPDFSFSDIRALNWLDGVRIECRDGAIVHLRPSGNAPQLRVYLTALQTERIGALKKVMLQPQGILDQLLA
jgi:phosphomannomutase